MSVNPCVLTDADDLPRDFHSRLIGLDDKAIVGGSAVTGDECGFHLALFLEWKGSHLMAISFGADFSLTVTQDRTT